MLSAITRLRSKSGIRRLRCLQQAKPEENGGGPKSAAGFFHDRKEDPATLLRRDAPTSIASDAGTSTSLFVGGTQPQRRSLFGVFSAVAHWLCMVLTHLSPREENPFVRIRRYSK